MRDDTHTPAERLAKAIDAAADAERITSDPAFVQAMERLEAQYTRQWQDSAPSDHGQREDSYYLLRALRAFRNDLNRVVAEPDVMRRQKRYTN